MKPLVSIIVPIYNSEKYLDLCISSLINQSYKELEIILVDDGSRDNSASICKKYAKKDKRIKYIYKENSGVSETRNIGIRESKGDYITFVDSDDYIGLNSIFMLVRKTTNEKIVSIGHYNVFGDNIEKNKYNVDSLTKNEIIKNILDSTIKGISVGYLYEASIVKEILFNKEINYLEDMLFIIEYFNKTNKSEIAYLKCEKDVAYYYVCNPNSATVSSNNMFNKYKMMNISLNKINEITENKYNDLINNKKIELLENALRFISSKKELLEFQKEFKINKYNKNKMRFKLFSNLYIYKMNNLLILYFKIRRNLKKVYLKIKGGNNNE